MTLMPWFANFFTCVGGSSVPATMAIIDIRSHAPATFLQVASLAFKEAARATEHREERKVAIVRKALAISAAEVDRTVTDNDALRAIWAIWIVCALFVKDHSDPARLPDVQAAMSVILGFIRLLVTGGPINVDAELLSFHHTLDGLLLNAGQLAFAYPDKTIAIGFVEVFAAASTCPQQFRLAKIPAGHFFRAFTAALSDSLRARVFAVLPALRLRLDRLPASEIKVTASSIWQSLATTTLGLEWPAPGAKRCSRIACGKPSTMACQRCATAFCGKVCYTCVSLSYDADARRTAWKSETHKTSCQDLALLK